MARSVCRAINCQNTKHSRPDLSFFRFPKDEERCLMWLDSVAKPGYHEKSTDALHRNNYICAEHFEPHCFMNNHRKSLVHNAVPTLYKGKEEEDVNDILRTLEDTDASRVTAPVVNEIDIVVANKPPINLLEAAHTADEDTLDGPMATVTGSVEISIPGLNSPDVDDEPFSEVGESNRSDFEDTPNSQPEVQSVSSPSETSNFQCSVTKSYKRKVCNESVDSPKQMVMFVPASLNIDNMELFSGSYLVDTSQDVRIDDAVAKSEDVPAVSDKACQTDLTVNGISQLEKECEALRKALTMICHKRLVIKKFSNNDTHTSDANRS